MEVNPFYLSSQIPDEYFCDRETETATLIRYVTNGNNVVLISPRRMGKSGLILHCFDKEVVRKNFATLYIDILQTSSLRELVYLLGKTVYDAMVPKTTKWITRFFGALKSLNGKFSIDAITGQPSFTLALGEIAEPLLTLEEIFGFIETYERKCIIAIDEFQQITKYPEKNIEAVLRAHIQRMNNAAFIFSGSERHLMLQMFSSYARPFYQSASFMVMNAIEKSVYVDFAVELFRRNNRKVDASAVERLYNLFDGYTFYLQKTLNECFSTQAPGEICDDELIERCLKNILESGSAAYRALLSNIPERQKYLLYAIALEGHASGINSSTFIKKYSLVSASSVQSASKQLLDKDYITRLDGTYSVNDRFLGLWIKSVYGSVTRFMES